MKLFSIPTVSEKLGIPEPTIRFWIWQGKIETVRLGRSVRIKEETINNLIERGTTPARLSK